MRTSFLNNNISEKKGRSVSQYEKKTNFQITRDKNLDYFLEILKEKQKAFESIKSNQFLERNDKITNRKDSFLNKPSSLLEKPKQNSKNHNDSISYNDDKRGSFLQNFDVFLKNKEYYKDQLNDHQTSTLLEKRRFSKKTAELFQITNKENSKKSDLSLIHTKICEFQKKKNDSFSQIFYREIPSKRNFFAEIEKQNISNISKLEKASKIDPNKNRFDLVSQISNNRNSEHRSESLSDISKANFLKTAKTFEIDNPIKGLFQTTRGIDYPFAKNTIYSDSNILFKTTREFIDENTNSFYRESFKTKKDFSNTIFDNTNQANRIFPLDSSQKLIDFDNSQVKTQISKNNIEILKRPAIFSRNLENFSLFPIYDSLKTRMKDSTVKYEDNSGLTVKKSFYDKKDSQKSNEIWLKGIIKILGFFESKRRISLNIGMKTIVMKFYKIKYQDFQKKLSYFCYLFQKLRKKTQYFALLKLRFLRKKANLFCKIPKHLKHFGKIIDNVVKNYKMFAFQKFILHGNGMKSKNIFFKHKGVNKENTTEYLITFAEEFFMKKSPCFKESVILTERNKNQSEFHHFSDRKKRISIKIEDYEDFIENNNFFGEKLQEVSFAEKENSSFSKNSPQKTIKKSVKENVNRAKKENAESQMNIGELRKKIEERFIAEGNLTALKKIMKIS